MPSPIAIQSSIDLMRLVMHRYKEGVSNPPIGSQFFKMQWSLMVSHALRGAGIEVGRQSARFSYRNANKFDIAFLVPVLSIRDVLFTLRVEGDWQDVEAAHLEKEIVSNPSLQRQYFTVDEAEDHEKMSRWEPYTRTVIGDWIATETAFIQALLIEQETLAPLAFSQPTRL
jgi:hypothetical protein